MLKRSSSSDAKLETDACLERADGARPVGRAAKLSLDAGRLRAELLAGRLRAEVLGPPTGVLGRLYAEAAIDGGPIAGGAFCAAAAIFLS